MENVIIDCYTDEPAGLGVPPYIGTYPRYIYGYLKEAHYLTIDDLRLYIRFNSRIPITKTNQRTNISIYNLTKNFNEIEKIFLKAKKIIIILGVHTPGKYLSAIPGTLKEIKGLLKGIKTDAKVTLTGPAVYGTQSQGGKFFEKTDNNIFDDIEKFDFNYDEIRRYSIAGSVLIKQIPDIRLAEIETGHGCQHGKCSFCTEPLKHDLEFRKAKDIIEEIWALYDNGIRHFRLGKQSCIYSYPGLERLLKAIRTDFHDIKTLHIDNANPMNVVDDKQHKKTKAIVEYCTAGNIAALGIESFDEKVIEDNCLNSDPETSYKAIEIINRYGKEIGNNGMPKFLPGLNILFGLKSESKDTHIANMEYLNKILKDDLLIRRINIRKVSIFENTPLFDDCKNKFLKKNTRHYWKWRNEIRQKIDNKMLEKVTPIGTILKDVYMETYDGNHTFGRQFGTYPLIVGINKREALKKFYDVKVTGHMLRSIVGEVI